MYFLLGLRKKKTPEKAVPPNSVHIVIPYILSRENVIFATPITALEKSNDLTEPICLEDFPWGTSSVRQFFGFDS